MQPLLDDGVEPGQQEVEPGSLVRLLAHPWSWHSAEGADEVSLHTRRGFKGEDTRASQKIDRHLQELAFACSFYVHTCQLSNKSFGYQIMV